MTPERFGRVRAGARVQGRLASERLGLLRRLALGQLLEALADEGLELVGLRVELEPRARHLGVLVFEVVR